jgi:hypothetical protein
MIFERRVVHLEDFDVVAVPLHFSQRIHALTVP